MTCEIMLFSHAVLVFMGCMLALHSLFLVQPTIIGYSEFHFLVMNLCLEAGTT